jgi:hypothetical protein
VQVKRESGEFHVFLIQWLLGKSCDFTDKDNTLFQRKKMVLSSTAHSLAFGFEPAE